MRDVILQIILSDLPTLGQSEDKFWTGEYDIIITGIAGIVCVCEEYAYYDTLVV